MNSRLPLAAIAALLLLGACLHSNAQTPVTLEGLKITIPPNREDVKAVGAGKTQIASGTTFNAMMYNPAFLARRATTVEVLGVGASLPRSSFDAIDFLKNPQNTNQLKTLNFLKDIRRGVTSLVSIIRNGGTTAEANAALSQISTGMQFVNELQEKVVGPSDNPKVHGFTAIPAVQVQFGNLGVSIYGVLQSGFTSFPTAPLTALYSTKVPTNLNDVTMEQLLSILSVLDPLIDPVTGDLNPYGAVPTTFAIAYLDVVGAVGYGYRLTPDLSLGANLKLINRRFSTKIIDADHYDRILSEVRSDFQTSLTGVTLDLGGLYHFRSTGTDIGVTLQNIIPLPKASSSPELSSIVEVPDGAGGVTYQKVFAKIPIELTAPFLANIGVTQPIFPGWTASLDWVDIASQDERYEVYGDRLRLGTEYRLDAVKDQLGIAFRMGMADRHFAGGIGLNIFRVVQIDGAYAYDTFFADNAYYAQIKFGW